MKYLIINEGENKIVTSTNRYAIADLLSREYNKQEPKVEYAIYVKLTEDK
jgi:hypothetical protein